MLSHCGRGPFPSHRVYGQPGFSRLFCLPPQPPLASACSAARQPSPAEPDSTLLPAAPANSWLPGLLSKQLLSPPAQDSLPEKLAAHEKNVREFDAFVETLQ